MTKRVGSSYLKILKMFLPVEKSYAKIDAWIRQNDDVESWVKKQEIHAKRYVLIEEEKITVYIIDNGKVAETYELQRNLCMSFLKDKELGLYSLD